MRHLVLHLWQEIQPDRKGQLWFQGADHKRRCIMKQFTNPVEGQNDGQETAATHGSLQLLCALERSKAAKRIAVPPRRSKCSGPAPIWKFAINIIYL